MRDILGYGGETPIVAGVDQALAMRPEVLLIGIAPSGGQLPPEFRRDVREAIGHGIEIWSGLHSFLGNDAGLSELAARTGARLWDVRRPPAVLDVAMGRALRARAFIVLTVGSDCNVGKMTAALEMEKEAQRRGYKAEFVATGQTGILIEGDGTPLDAIPGDFMSGEVERLVMACDADGADAVFVEGQGALMHPGFGPVTLALMLGAMPDAFVLVHQPERACYRPDYDIELPPLPDIIEGYERLMLPYKAPKTTGVCLNTYHMSEQDGLAAIQDTARQTGLPTTDPVRTGIGPIVDALEPHIRRKLGWQKTG